MSNVLFVPGCANGGRRLSLLVVGGVDHVAWACHSKCVHEARIIFRSIANVLVAASKQLGAISNIVVFAVLNTQHPEFTVARGRHTVNASTCLCYLP